MARQSLLRLSRLVLPAAFLGYTAYANLAAFSGRDAARLAQVEGSFVEGEATASLSGLYARAVPHREAAAAWIGAARFALAGEGRRGVEVGRDGWLFTEEEFVVASDAEIARAVEEAATAAARLAERGTRLVVVPVPAKIDVARGHAADLAAAEAMAAQHRRFLDALAEAGLDAADPRPALIQAQAEGQAFFARDTHWTPEGARAAAEAVADAGFVTPGTDGFARRPSAPEAVPGDLVTFVTSAALASRLGLGPEAAEPFVAEALGDAGGIFAADAAPITTVLVGTSYSADARWSFAPALSLALGRDVLNLAEEGQGPVRPLRSLLGDASGAGAQADYVLWEFPIRYLGDPSIWPEDRVAGATAAPEGSL